MEQINGARLQTRQSQMDLALLRPLEHATEAQDFTRTGELLPNVIEEHGCGSKVTFMATIAFPFHFRIYCFAFMSVHWERSLAGAYSKRTATAGPDTQRRLTAGRARRESP